MKLEDIEFGIGFNNEMVMGIKGKKVTPLIITNRVVALVKQYLEAHGESGCVWDIQVDANTSVSLTFSLTENKNDSNVDNS